MEVAMKEKEQVIDESKHQLNELQSKIESAYVEVKYEFCLITIKILCELTNIDVDFCVTSHR